MKDWIAAIRADNQIKTANELLYKSLQNSIPHVVQAMATVLSQPQDSNLETLVETSLEHGIIRAEQGFEAGEIAREYRILCHVQKHNSRCLNLIFKPELSTYLIAG